MITPLHEFLGQLPQILAGREKLDCFFTTYREVRGFRPGTVPVHKPGLSIRVSEGGNQSWGALLLLVGLSNPEPIREEAHELLNDAVRRAGIPDGNTPFLLVIYAGLMAFDETIEFVLSVRAKSPKAVIVVVTCDCELQLKTSKLRSLLRDGTVNFATEHYECGGRDAMATILKAVIDNWQPATAD